MQSSLQSKMFSLLASKDPSQNVGSFCDEHGLAKANYYYWSKKYKAQNNPGDETLRNFIPIEVKANRQSPLLTIELVSGHLVHAYDADAFSFMATLLK